MEFNKFEQPNDFRYILTTSSVVNMILDVSPKDWQDTTVTIKKDFVEYYANKREFTIPLSFTREAKAELKKEYLTNGINGFATVEIQLLNRSNWQYEFFYNGFVDFAKANLDDNFIEINFLDNSIQSKMKAFEKTEFELQFDDDLINGEDWDADLPSIKTIENLSLFIISATANDVNTPWSRLPATSINESNIRLQNMEFKDQYSDFNYEATWQPEKWPDKDDNYFGRCFQQGLELQITYNAIFSGRYVVNASKHYYFDLVFTEVWFDSNSNSWVSDSKTLISGNFWGEGDFSEEIEDVTLTHTTNSNDSYLYFWFRRSEFGATSFDYSLRIQESFFKIKYNDYTDAIIKRTCKTPFVIFRELFKKMTGDENIIVKSDILQSMDNILITSGDAIRNINGALIKTSWSKFWKSMSSLEDLAFDILDDVPTVELKKDFLVEDIIITHLDSVRNVSISTALDSIFNDVKTGYSSEDYDTELGRQEQNNGQTWITPISKAVKTLDIVSDYRADAYGINEIILNNLYNPNKNDTDTDSSTDNDIYMIYCDTSKRFPSIDGKRRYMKVLTLEGLEYSGIETNDYYYNWMISPKRNLVKHSKLLATSNFGEVNQDKQITLTKSDKLANLRVTYKSEYFDEKAPIDIYSLGIEYFLPFEITIEAAFSNDFYRLYSENSKGCISFEYNEKIFKMFIKEINFDILNMSEFEITGFLCPDQNIKELI